MKQKWKAFYNKDTQMGQKIVQKILVIAESIAEKINQGTSVLSILKIRIK